MYALIVGSIRPCFVSSPPTIHREMRMMTSMAMLKTKGEMVQPAMMLTFKGLPCCSTLLCCKVLYVLKVGLDKVENGFQYAEVIQSSPKEFVRDRSDKIGEV